MSSIILCVEDKRDHRKLLTFLLARGGYEVVTARDGKQGVQMARVWRPGLILMDIFLPDMTGIEAIREIKKDPITRQIPIVVLSAFDQQYLIEEAKEAGADDYLIKTILPAQLMETINRYVQPISPSLAEETGDLAENL